MLCEKCGVRNGTTHIKRTVNGVTKEYFLCQHCANKLGLNSFNFFDNNYFDWIFKGNETQQKVCENCKSTYEDILYVGRMGCPKCYETFKEELTPSLIKMQKSLTHIGKQSKVDINQIDEIKNLENELKHAISNEEYEKAAEIRDLIKIKKGEQNG